MKKRIWSVFILALPYVITVLFPIISVMCLSITVMDNYNEKILADQQVNIERAFEGFQQKVNSVETLANAIAKNDEILEYIYVGSGNSGHTALDYLEFREVLYSYMVNNNVELIYYYDKQQNRIISNEGTYSSAAQFFEGRYRIDGNTVEESVTRLRNSSWDSQYSPVIKITKGDVLSNLATEVIEYRLFLPLEMFSNYKGQLVMVMDVETIFSDFHNLLNNTGEFYVYDRNDTLLYSSGTRFEHLTNSLGKTAASELRLIDNGSEEVYGMVCNSDNRFWRVEVYTTGLLETDGIGALPQNFGLMVVVPVVLSFLLCIYFTHKNQREIHGILMLFNGEDENKHSGEIEEVGYHALREYAHRMISENNSFKERITTYEYSRKYEILDKLLRKTYATREEMIQELTGLELGIKEGKCVVLCIRYEGVSYRTSISEDVTIKDFVKELLSQMLDQQFELFDTSARETICVLAVGDNADMEISLRNIISKLNVEISYHYGIEISVAAGDVVESLYLMNDSYMQAREVLSYNETFDNKISLYSKLVQNKDVYYFPQDYDEMIYNYVVVGDGEKAKEIIQKIYDKNFGENVRSLSPKAIETIKEKIRETIDSLAAEYYISMESIFAEEFQMHGQDSVSAGDSENVLQQMYKEQNSRQYFDTVCYIVDRIVAEIEKEKKIVQNTSAIKLMNYVNENYYDSTLSLKSISTVFGMNESYISNLFKKEYGENLSVVIERLRIEKAGHLIKTTDMKIGEIAESVGYTSDASFRRAFKKITGMSPGEYRESK